MRSALAVLVIGVLSLGSRLPVHAQAVSGSETTVIVQGCLKGNRLRLDKSSPTTAMVAGSLNTNEFLLEGEKGLLQTLKKQHDGHQDELTGVVIVPSDSDTRVKSQRVAKGTSVTVTSTGASPDPRGQRTGPARIGDPSRRDMDTIRPNQSVRMTVTGLRHLANRCEAESSRGRPDPATPIQ